MSGCLQVEGRQRDSASLHQSCNISVSSFVSFMPAAHSHIRSWWSELHAFISCQNILPGTQPHHARRLQHVTLHNILVNCVGNEFVKALIMLLGGDVCGRIGCRGAAIMQAWHAEPSLLYYTLTIFMHAQASQPTIYANALTLPLPLLKQPRDRVHLFPLYILSLSYLLTGLKYSVEWSSMTYWHPLQPLCILYLYFTVDL